MSRQIGTSVYADSASQWMSLPGDPKEALISILGYLLGLPAPDIPRALVIESCNQMSSASITMKGSNEIFKLLLSASFGLESR